MRKTVLLLTLIVLVLAGCTNKTVHTDTLYCYHKENQGGFHGFPQLYLDSEKQTFQFIYDDKNNGINREGTYEIKGNKLILTGIRKEEKYVFRIIDENTLEFIQEGSNEVRDGSGYYYPLENGDRLYDFRFKPYELSEFDVEKIMYTCFTAGNNDYLESGFEYAKYDRCVWCKWQDDRIVINRVDDHPGYLTLVDDSVPRSFVFIFDGLSSPDLYCELSGFDTKELFKAVKEGRRTVMVNLMLGEGLSSAYFVLEENGRIHMLLRSAYAEGPNDGQILSAEQMTDLIPYLQVAEIYEWDEVLR